MVIALIPARGGSKGVPKKNLYSVQGYPLIAYSIVAARACVNIDKVIVSTDSEEIAAIARQYGADVPFLRPSQYSQDSSADADFVKHALNWFNENGIFPDLFVHLRPTTPLREPILIDQAIDKIKQFSSATSLRSAHLCPESPFKWFLLEENFFRGITTDSMDFINNPRQQFPQVYVPNGYVDILKIQNIRETGTIHGNKVLSFITPTCIEIDSIDDFRRLDFEIKSKPLPLFKHLRANYPNKELI